MCNQVFLIGRLVDNPKIIKSEENNNKKCIITLAVNREYKNIDGIYETDFINCELWDGISEKVCEYCRKGDLVCIKGRLVSENDLIRLIADKISFLSTRKENEEKKDEED